MSISNENEKHKEKREKNWRKWNKRTHANRNSAKGSVKLQKSGNETTETQVVTNKCRWRQKKPNENESEEKNVNEKWSQAHKNGNKANKYAQRAKHTCKSG